MDGMIFDMDGVLINSDPFYLNRRIQFCEEVGIQPGSTNIADYIGKTQDEIWNTLIPQESQSDDLRVRYNHYRVIHSINFKDALNEDSTAVFKILKHKNKKIAIASSSPKSEILRMLEETGLKVYVDFVISGEEIEFSKPNPDIYLIAQEKLGAGNYLAVEDSEIGIRAAKSAGLYTVALKFPFVSQMDQSLADNIIENLRDVIPLIDSE